MSLPGGELPLALDFGQSVGRFLDAVGQFGRSISDITWPALAVALALYLLHLLARARAWQNVLRAAYPATRVPFPQIAAAYLAGAGLNSFLPARAGDAVKIMLAKNSVPRSSYPAITSSFFVQTVFDSTVGLAVLIYAISLGLLPGIPDLPDLPAFELSFWAENPRVFIFAVTVTAVGLVALFAVLARHVERFWERVKQGVVILTDFPRYLRQVASWQGAAWVLRFGSFWFFLEAFNIGGSVSNVLLVFAVQSVAGFLPVTPGGIGPQQALLVATLTGPGRAAVLAYSVGQQAAITVWTAILGFAALTFVFRTRDWRGLVRKAEEERDRHEAASQD